MKRLATLLLCSALIPLPFVAPAYAQGSASTVVTTCGTQSIPTSQGTSGTFIDGTGDLCTNASGGGGGGGAVFGPTATGSASANPPVQVGGTINGGATGNVQGLAIKAASTAPAATDPAAVVALSPNGGQATATAQASQLTQETGTNTNTATIAAAVGSSIPAGANIIGKVGIDQTTPGTTDHVSAAQVGAWTAQPISGTTGGVTPFTLTAANSTNAANVKATPGTLYHIGVYNNSATLAWVSFYNTAGTPTCGTSIVYQTMIPANSTSGAGAVEDFTTGMAFATGIGICVTTGIAGTGSVAATSYVVGLGYK